MKQAEEERPVAGSVPPTPVKWEHTYVSIRGSQGQGEEIPLTGFSNRAWPGIVLMPGATGLDAPPVELHSDESPNLDGSIFRSARTAAREVMIPLYLYAVDRRTLKELKSKLLRALDARKGYCVLKFMETDSAPRYLRCYYKGGMEGDESTENSGFTWTRYGLQLTAFDPWFYSDEIPVAQWVFGEGDPFLSTVQPFFPLHITSGRVSESAISVENPGDIEAWPVWQITGPVKSFRFISPKGEAFGIAARQDGTDVVAAGRTLTIDTRPGYKLLRDDQGVNYWPLLEANPVLWAIPDGRSQVGVQLTSSSSAAKLRMSLTPRYGSY